MTPSRPTAASTCCSISAVPLIVTARAGSARLSGSVSGCGSPPRRLRSRDQVARAFAADAGVVGVGRDDPRLIEFARQIGELVDYGRGSGGAHRRGERVRIENIAHGGD